MAALASRDHSVLLLVAARAGQGVVLRRGRAEEIDDDLVAHSAVFGRRGVGKGGELRHVGFMAEIASVGDLSLVRRMAPCAGGELPVDIMAVGTVKGRMLARICSQHPALQPVAGQTGLCAHSLE